MGAHMPLTQRRKVLLEGAWRVIHDQGIGAATTRAITAEAGLPLASFHYCFESHDDLIMELARNLMRELTASAMPDFAKARNPEDFVRVSCRFIVDFVIRDPNTYWAGLELSHYALRKRELDGLAQRFYDEIIELNCGLVSMIEGLGFEWTRPTREIAWQLLSINDGIVQCYLATKDADAAYRMADVMASAVASQARPRPARDAVTA